MALNITRIDATEVRGTLDGTLPFEVRREGEAITARIEGWSRNIVAGLPVSVAAMRATAYETIARYREDMKLARSN